jgi:PKD repeat protein
VGAGPTADFEANSTQIFTGESVDFTNLSLGEDVTYEWLFEGGIPETSTDENPAGIVYNTQGIFDVRLIATNIFGTDTLSKIEYIDVLPVGIEELNRDMLSIYPNPAVSQITIKFNNQAPYELIVNTLLGKVVDNLRVVGKTTNLDVESYESGIYILMVRNLETNDTSTRKIVIRK